MKFKKISTRMLAIIVPVLIASMVILTMISVSNSRSTISEQIEDRMEAELKAAEENVENSLNGVSTMASVIASSVGATSSYTGMAAYEKMLAEIIQTNDMVLGSGLWFEPYAYDKSEEYMGPYVYKDGDSIELTYDYSNADYDYFSQEYYLNAKNSTKPVITNPYYDETSGTVMSSCSAPIIVDGEFIGCVTVDMELSSVQNMVNDIQVGKNGTGMLLDSVGTYLAGVDESLISTATPITSDSNATLAAAGSVIMSNDTGEAVYNDETYGTTDLYYTTIPSTGWKVIIRMPQAEVNQPIQQLFVILMIVTVVAIVLEILIVVLQIRGISKGIGQVKNFAGQLAEGDFSVDPIEVRTADELGLMSTSLNEMYDSNKDVISGIARYAVEIDESSTRLSVAAGELAEQFSSIQTLMNSVNEDMMTTSAATEQVNASTEEVLSNVSLLASEADESEQMSKEIRERAADIEKQSSESSESAIRMTEQFSTRLNQSIENAKVVESISELTDVISNIAEQINLLSLNASIEAARAGEAGRGFAVVATEIGSLAGSTTEAVGKIQETISQVQDAFNDLTGAAGGLLDFVQETVSPDYKLFVEVAGQYGGDAARFQEKSNNISEMAANIKHIMGEVTDAIQNIAEATQSTTDNSNQIMSSIEVVSDHVDSVSTMSGQQQETAENLNTTVGRFKLSQEDRPAIDTTAKEIQ